MSTERNANEVPLGGRKLEQRKASFTCDQTMGNLYYFAIADRALPPYLTQRHVEAIIDIASDGTLAGVELIDDMPPPPAPGNQPAGEVGDNVLLPALTELERILDGFAGALKAGHNWTAIRQSDYEKANATMRELRASARPTPQ